MEGSVQVVGKPAATPPPLGVRRWSALLVSTSTHDEHELRVVATVVFENGHLLYRWVGILQIPVPTQLRVGWVGEEDLTTCSRVSSRFNLSTQAKELA